MRDSARLKAKPNCVGCAAATCTCGLLIRNQPLFLLSYGDVNGAHGRSCGSCRCANSAPHLMMTRYRASALHPHWTASEAVVSALDYMGMKWVALDGVAPSTLRFKGACSAD